MILGIGIDIAQIDRFESFKDRSGSLLSIYTKHELELGSSCEYYASRFAAKEAFYKALSNALITLGLTDQSFSFQFTRTNVEVVKSTWDIPTLRVNWKAFEDKLEVSLPKVEAHLSISHERGHAIAMVVLSN